MRPIAIPPRDESGRQRAKCGRVAVALALVWGVTGCSLDGLLKSDQLPPDVTDPALTKTPEGALAAYRGTLILFRAAFGGSNIAPLADAGIAASEATFVPMTGRLSDELQVGTLNSDLVDSRSIAGSINNATSTRAYSVLQQVRGQASQAAGLLVQYVPEQPALLGQVYALTGYTEIFLAELFCAGIPLSTLDFNGDYTYRPGSTTAEVLTHAIALFDTALTLVSDSARFVPLVQVGKARALLALGDYAGAAAAVATVPDGYSYTINFSATNGSAAQNFAIQATAATALWKFSMADHEGLNGLDYRSSGDPRTKFTVKNGTGLNAGKTVYFPQKYAPDGSSPIVLASGIEARLIEAEAALQAGDTTAWLAKLNYLRETAWPTIVPAVTGPLPDTTDPGTPDARVDLLFRERAFWLFLTGHRQGDLRRLIRQYGRDPDQVYPAGSYPSGGLYGTDVVMPIPADEEVLNPYFTGCASTGA